MGIIAALCGGNGIATSCDTQFAPTKFDVHRNKFSLSYVGANCVRFCKIMRFYLIYGIYLANKYPQTCRDRRLDGPSRTKKFNVIYGGYLLNRHLQICRAVACLPPKKNNDDRCNLRRL